jgi:hypothetical protein
MVTASNRLIALTCKKPDDKTCSIIKRHDGEPKPEPPVEPDPNLRSWSVHLLGGKKMQSLGVIEALSEAAAIERAVVLFALDDERRKRLAVNLRR